MMPMKTHMKAD